MDIFPRQKEIHLLAERGNVPACFDDSLAAVMVLV